VFRRAAEGWVINYQNFYWTLFITICWTASNVTVGVTLGMILALALNTRAQVQAGLPRAADPALGRSRTTSPR